MAMSQPILKGELFICSRRDEFHESHFSAAKLFRDSWNSSLRQYRNQFAASSGSSGTQNGCTEFSSYARASELADASIASINFSV